MAEDKLTLEKPDQVVIRMYGQGFGDCFLLALPRVQNGQAGALDDPVYVVIDSGVFKSTPGEKERMKAVAESIKLSTGGRIDLLVATHEHYDHLSGFESAPDEWMQIQVRHIWLAWTEDPKHPATQKYDKEKQALQLQAAWALEVARAYRRQDPALQQGLQRVQALVGFAGDEDVEPESDPLPDADGKVRPPRETSKLPDRVLDDFAKEPGKRFHPDGKTERFFCEPGQVRTVTGTEVDAYVLGPPTAEGRLGQDMVAGEVYRENETNNHSGGDDPDTSLAALARQLEFAAAAGRAERESIASAVARRIRAEGETALAPDTGMPFRSTVSLPYRQAAQHPYFRDRYFKGRSDRQIETDWLHSFGRLSLQVDKVINNTSLVLAFRLPDERVLLFVGDAQVGNWLSWYEIQPKDWRRPEGGQVDYRPTAAQLLAQTVVYKVGHHGSHNATLEKRGLEKMQDGLIAFVPTSRIVPQKKRGWHIPLGTLTDALWRKSGGQVVFPHEHPDYSYANTRFQERVKSSEEMFAPMVSNEEILEEAVPLWREVRI